ncbi:RING-H2 finger protein ATL66-like [Prosopis cineraria]|uniref:RING-H2 finger protein ATL66-like n=1 Tax=Prosopis cineraria TaxID=364024 RepID=UPI00240FF639|nr:RING-H2 finger protein ATL66-like [Prosopis cineraria]
MAFENDHLHIFQWRFIEINHSNFHSYSHGIFLLLFFFSLIILIVTLFLLAHLCRQRFRVTSQVPASSTLQWAKFEMESMENKSVGDSNVECCICLSVLKDVAKVKVLPECEHAYHSECVDMWLSANPSCPLCRRKEPRPSPNPSDVEPDNSPNQSVTPPSRVAHQKGPLTGQT